MAICSQCAPENILKPKIVLNQKHAPSVTTSIHSMQSKMLSGRILIWLLLYHIYDKVKRVMMKSENILEQIDAAFAVWCAAGVDATELARMASIAIERKIDVMSVAPDDVAVVWPWIENKKIKIFPRFYVNKSDVETVSGVSRDINLAFKNGADGAMVFLSQNQLDFFVSQIYLIRDDLFFNKSFFVGLDISEIGPFDWKNVFLALAKVRADGLVLSLTNDTGDKSDFVGRLYAALDAWGDTNMSLYFVLGAKCVRIEQAMRLVQSMRPELVDKTKFFVTV